MGPNDQLHIGSASFRREQRAIGLAMTAAAVIAILVLTAAALADRSTAPVPFSARLEHSLRLDVFVIAWLLATVGNVARLRFFSKRDIGGSNSEDESSKVRDARAVVQNTLEQVVLAVVTHLIVAATFNQSTWTIAGLVGLFAVGRLLFWAGYKHGGKGRALGFGLTFYPNVLAWFASAAVVVAG